MMKHAVFLISMVSVICVVCFYMLYVMYYCLFVYMVCVLLTYLIFNSINRFLICETKLCMHACKCAGITITVMTRLQAGVKYFFLTKLLRPAVSPPSLIFEEYNGSLQTYTTWSAKLTSDVQLLELRMNAAYVSLHPPT